MTDGQKFLQQVKNCFICNMVYLLIGIIIFTASITYICYIPDFNWVIVVSFCTALCLIIMSLMTVIRCIRKIKIE